MDAQRIARFWAKVDRSGGPSACWLWRAFRTRWGYGLFRAEHRGPHRGGMKAAHRVSWMLTHGEIPSGRVVMHSCDNPPCVNPAHLSLGTHTENAHDRDRKGRTARGVSVSIQGERHPAHRLTEVDVRRIRAALREGARGCDLAEQYRVTRSSICDINRGRTWAHLA